MNSKRSKYILILILTLCLSSCIQSDQADKVWHEISSQEKPWTRWWWMGSAVDKINITTQLEAFAEAGLGGVEVTPIYGVKGYEDSFIEYLSPQWIDMFDHTLSEAERLGLGVDLNLGTGWPYGGPQVEPHYAASKLGIMKYHLNANETFDRVIEMRDPKQKGLTELQHVIFFDEGGAKVDITSLIKEERITYTPTTDTDIYAVFCTKTRQQVNRAAPGGEGYTIDHFSSEALKDYLEPYDSIMMKFNGRLHGIFNDSYEVYQSDYTSAFMSEFKNLRKYDLLDYIPLLYDKKETEIYTRILCDYRETISDLLIKNFAEPWNSWSNSNGFITKYQAHGSPGNLIDLYARADIPECEIFGSPSYDIPGYRRDSGNIRNGVSNKMMLKFCSSAAHLKGNELVSSESFTWLREHFKTGLSHCKPQVDDLLLSGVNHIFLHGSTYSPEQDPWPGFTFYASVNFNPTNTIWKDAPFLFDYIARCQSILQDAKTDNEVLLYWPVHDLYTAIDPSQLVYQVSIHSMDKWLLPTSFYKVAKDLDEKGFGFDFISDDFISGASFGKNNILILGKTHYKSLIVPDLNSIPLETLQKLLELKKSGANILFMGQPKTVPGFFQYKSREKKLTELVDQNRQWFQTGMDLEAALNDAGIKGEKAANAGLKILRKILDGHTLYFIANHSTNIVNQFVDFNADAKSVLIMNPLTGETGFAEIKEKTSSTGVKLYLQPGESVFLVMYKKPIKGSNWEYRKTQDEEIIINSPWKLEFIEGGATLPKAIIMDSLESWTTFGNEYENFSGTVKYTTEFEISELKAEGYSLNFGQVRESARITLNGHFAGTVFAHPFNINISEFLQEGINELEMEVTNLAANRLRALEISGIQWKKFYDINMVNIHYEPFDAKIWNVEPSGLIGQVKIIPVYYH